MKRIACTLFLGTVGWSSPIRSVGCAPTAEAAVARLIAGAPATETDGFRVAAVHVDRLRHQQWAMVASCSQPALPQRAILLPADAAVAAKAASAEIVIRNGDAVQIASSGIGSTMTLSGVATESGAVGQKILVRLNLKLEASAPTTLVARVVGAGAVEIVR